MPDIFMPVDTSYATQLYTDLVRKGIFNRFTVDYVMEHRKEIIEQYGDFENFDDNFQVTDSMIEDFKNYAEKEKVKWNEEQYDRSAPLIKLQLKALIARNEWDMEAYYKVVMQDDKVVQKAVEILNDSNQYRKILNR